MGTNPASLKGKLMGLEVLLLLLIIKYSIGNDKIRFR